MANASTMAGMAFANAFLGVCHSMAHKLGAFHHLPHGVANALLIEEVLRFNAAEVPAKMGTFPQYDHPHTLRRYAEIAEFLGLKGKNDQEKLDNLVAAVHDASRSRWASRTPSVHTALRRRSSSPPWTKWWSRPSTTSAPAPIPAIPLMSEIKQMYLNAYYGKKEEA